MLIYDGDCSFCTVRARQIAAHWRDPATAVAWQQLRSQRLDELGLTIEQVSAAAWWVSADGSTYSGHDAIAHALLAARGWRRLAGRIIGHPALGWLAAPTYQAVAKHRHRLPGATKSCRL